jgi:hypothetical protein
MKRRMLGVRSVRFRVLDGRILGHFRGTAESDIRLGSESTEDVD